MRRMFSEKQIEKMIIDSRKGIIENEEGVEGPRYLVSIKLLSMVSTDSDNIFVSGPITLLSLVPFELENEESTLLTAMAKFIENNGLTVYADIEGETSPQLYSLTSNGEDVFLTAVHDDTLVKEVESLDSLSVITIDLLTFKFNSYDL